MALEVISAVEEAENAAAKIRSDAKLESANILAKADADGKATVEEAKRRASEQIAQIAGDLDKKADDDIEGITPETNVIKRDLMAAASTHMEAAVELIKERIVKG